MGERGELVTMFVSAEIKVVVVVVVEGYQVRTDIRKGIVIGNRELLGTIQSYDFPSNH